MDIDTDMADLDVDVDVRYGSTVDSGKVGIRIWVFYGGCPSFFGFEIRGRSHSLASTAIGAPSTEPEEYSRNMIRIDLTGPFFTWNTPDLRSRYSDIMEYESPTIWDRYWELGPLIFGSSHIAQRVQIYFHYGTRADKPYVVWYLGAQSHNGTIS